MNRALIFDGMQGLGLALIGAGTWSLYGWPAAAVTAGAVLIATTLLELHLLRRG